MSRSVTWSQTLTFFEDDWHDGNVPIMGVRTHAAWLCTSVFDGARAFEGVTPDLDLHCARVNESAKVMSLKPLVSTETWMTLAREGLKRFDRDAELYIYGRCIGPRMRRAARCGRTRKRRAGV